MTKKLFYSFAFLFLIIIDISAQTTTAFRKDYNQAMFDLPGNIIEGLTQNTYVMTGTNLNFLPIYGTVSQLNDTGAVVWSYRYSDASIGFQLNDIKKNMANNQYYLCGGSESNAAVFMILDPAGNVLNSKKFNISEADGAWFNRIVKVADGGYVAVGYVTGYDPDGAGPEIKYNPITWTSSTNGTTHTDAISSPLIVKLDVNGNHVWHKVFRYYTAATKNPSTERIYNNASFKDVVEVADGYVAVGSYDVNQHRSVTSGDDEDDATPQDALILKTTTAGVITYHKQIDLPSSSTTQSSKYLAAVNKTSAGDIIAAGSTDDGYELIQKFVGTGGFSNIFSRRFRYSTSFFGTLTDPVDVSQIYEVTGSTDLVTMSMYIKPLSFFANAIHRVNSTATTNVWTKRYNFNLVSILPRGGQTSDNGYISMSMTFGGTDYDYHVFKTDPNGDTPLTGCPPTSFSPTASAGPTTFADPHYNSWSGTPGPNTIGIARTAITLTPNYICTKTACITPAAATTVTATPNPICAGQSTTITASGPATGVTYQVYTAATGGTNLGTTPLVVTPGVTTTYHIETVNNSDPNCVSTTRTSVTVTVNPSPTVTANASPSTSICVGDLVTLTGGGATSYTWDNGVTNGVAFSPATTTTYIVIGTTSGCSDTAQITITVNAAPTVTANASPSNTICAGSSVTLTGSGATSYTWNNGVTDGVAFVPAATTTYTVIGNVGSCADTAQITITVNPAPTVTANASPSTTVCAGNPVTLTGGGATSYTWDNGVTDGVAFTPTVTTTYTVTGTDANNCTNTAQITITVNPAPTITANASPSTTICAGTPVTLTGGGAASYSWDNGVIDGVAFTPTVTTTYTVTGTDANNCTNTAQITITVNPAPTVTANASPATSICVGDQVTLTGGGATSYTWDNGVTDGVAFTPATTTTYTVTGTDANNCTNTAQITITVSPAPTVTANASPSTTICAGDTVTLTGSGATSYTWDNGVTDGVPFVPTTTTTYNVTGSTGTCSDVDQITITVNPAPTITANASSITSCAGDTVTLTGSGGVSYTWDNGVTDGVPFIATATATYTVTGTGANGCTNTDQVTVTVNPTPTVTANASPSTTICNGDPLTLTGSGATSYTWDNGVTDGVAFVPTATTTYTVTGTDANGCFATDQITITVTTCIVPQASFTVSDSVVCAGGCIDFTDTSSDALSWSWTFAGGNPSSSSDQNPTVCFDSAGIFTVQLVVTNAFGTDSMSTQIVVHPNPTIVAGSDVTIMFGNTANLTSTTTSTSSFSWTPSFNVVCPTCQNTQANPEETTTYTVTLTDTNGCVARDSMTVFIEFENIIWVPNIFSPNGDGSNDILFVRGKGIQSVLFFIYDRWGEKVFETTDINLGWDGTFNGEPMNKAVFVYYVEATFMDGSKATKKGDVTLIR